MTSLFWGEGVLSQKVTKSDGGTGEFFGQKVTKNDGGRGLFSKAAFHYGKKTR